MLDKSSRGYMPVWWTYLMRMSVCMDEWFVFVYFIEIHSICFNKIKIFVNLKDFNLKETFIIKECLFKEINNEEVIVKEKSIRSWPIVLPLSQGTLYGRLDTLGSFTNTLLYTPNKTHVHILCNFSPQLSRNIFCKPHLLLSYFPSHHPLYFITSISSSLPLSLHSFHSQNTQFIFLRW